jgi:hypothetical protein
VGLPVDSFLKGGRVGSMVEASHVIIFKISYFVLMFEIMLICQ